MAEVRITKNNWARFARDIVEGVDDVVETYAGLMEASAAVAAPYEFGVLQESIAVEGAHGGAALARRRIVVGAYYGLFQHEGTDPEHGDGIDPNPFLADAVSYWAADCIAAVGLVVRRGG